MKRKNAAEYLLQVCLSGGGKAHPTQSDLVWCYNFIIQLTENRFEISLVLVLLIFQRLASTGVEPLVTRK